MKVKRCINYCVAACLALACLSIDVNLARASGVRDQGRIFGTDGVISLGADSWSQSITTGIAGELQGIQIQIADNNRPIPPTIDFEFSVFDGGNPPTCSVLFSQQLTLTGIVSEYLYTWDVSSAKLFFDVGDVFTFALSVQQSGVDIAADYQYDGSGYAGGELFKNGTALPLETSDMAFITYVVDVSAQPTAKITSWVTENIDNSFWTKDGGSGGGTAYFDIWIEASDPDGIDDITYVKVTNPEGYYWVLRDSGTGKDHYDPEGGFFGGWRRYYSSDHPHKYILGLYSY